MRYVACTLGPLDGRQRVDDWRRLAAAAGVGRQLAGRTLTLRFRALPGVQQELDRLVDAERDCCAFLGWELTESAAELHVHVTGDPDELKALAIGA